MVKGREKSDGCGVPEDCRKAVRRAKERRRGKATTTSKRAEQLVLLRETADSPQGDVGGAALGQPEAAPTAVPKSRNTKRTTLLAMTMEAIANEDNLSLAFQRVASNQGAPGPDRRSILEVREHLDVLLPSLSRELLNGSYRPGMIRRVWIPKAGGKRGLGIPNVIDRIVGQAVHQVLSPHFDSTFHESSHGFRPGRSCHTAITEAKRHVEDGFDWVVDIDLERFFDRVHHQRLIARLGMRISDERVLKLIHHMLKAKVILEDGVVLASEEGTPQGAPLSPLLSNIVLDELDWELASRGHRFVRYADDLKVYVRSERAGTRVMAGLSRFIEGRLHLRVNQNKSAVDMPEQRHFVGFRLQRRRGRVQIRLSSRTQKRIRTRIRELTPRSWGQSLDVCLKQLNRYLLGWIQFYAFCSAEERWYLQKLDSHIRRRLRAIVLKHWRRKRSIVRRLIKLGVPSRMVRITVYGGHKATWALSRCEAIHRGLRNGYFSKRGLVSLELQWEKLNHQIVIAPRQQLVLTLE